VLIAADEIDATSVRGRLSECEVRPRRGVGARRAAPVRALWQWVRGRSSDVGAS
jgi:hypothetical protein